MVLMDEQLGGIQPDNAPAVTAKATLSFFHHFQTPKTTKGRYKSDLSMYDISG
ncbi:hypothetical protein THOB06_180009 [Vibrio rotiferianus]|nr:hypothetical protein THOG10_180008 [Vibrio rotiferianus]CAH1569514.1 hypothetical protein THOB06_180009 [Vibrio rotiferianus]